MKFSKFYLTENAVEKSKVFKDLKNILSGFQQKEPSEIKKRPKGVVIKFSPVGSWTTFVSNLKNNLKGYRFLGTKSDKDQLAFKNNSLLFWTRLVGNDAFVYVTNQSNPKEPDWGEEVETEPEEIETEPVESPAEVPEPTA